MSAWQIFSALGFYPLQMGSPTYAIGSPLFTKATVNLENGRKLVINAPKNSKQNIYVQGLKVNGKAYDKTFLNHDQLAGGGTLDFDMGPKPSAWGTGADSVPPHSPPATRSPNHCVTPRTWLARCSTTAPRPKPASRRSPSNRPGRTTSSSSTP